MTLCALSDYEVLLFDQVFTDCVCTHFSVELEALGDDLALDEDTSYLDEVPAPSDTIPGEQDSSGTKTQVHSCSLQFPDQTLGKRLH